MAEDIINSRSSLDAYIKHLEAQFEKHKYLRVTVKTGKQRSLTQNAALHLYCEHVAQRLNDGGFDFRATIKDGVDVPWTSELVKQYMWRTVQKAVTGHESTTKPESSQYIEIYEVLNNHLSTKFGVFCPWPSRDNQQEIK